MSTPIRLVIVDDHEMIRETWKMILQRDERIHVVAECESGEEAIECAKKVAPDVMLMDVNMSPVNGFEATHKISKEYPDIKIIGISINNQLSYTRNMIQMGARGYVTKSAASEEMLEAIMTVKNGEIYICRDIREKLDGNPF